MKFIWVSVVLTLILLSNVNTTYGKYFLQRVKLTKFKIDPNTVTVSGAKFFKPMRVNYVLVDEKLEVNKTPTLISKEDYDHYFKTVIKPVDDYIKYLISVYQTDIKSNGKCYSDSQDKNGKKYRFEVNMDDYLKDYVSYIIPYRNTI